MNRISQWKLRWRQQKSISQEITPRAHLNKQPTQNCRHLKGAGCRLLRKIASPGEGASLFMIVELWARLLKRNSQAQASQPPLTREWSHLRRTSPAGLPDECRSRLSWHHVEQRPADLLGPPVTQSCAGILSQGTGYRARVNWKRVCLLLNLSLITLWVILSIWCLLWSGYYLRALHASVVLTPYHSLIR